ncbi:MAG: VOC family protein [Chloroflexi bacterium]|nr:VOC family protein [Chloroflexota bacterium]
MLGRIDLITLLVDDVPTCAAFYRDVLGFRVAGDASGDYVEFANDGVRFALYPRRLLAQFTGNPSDAASRVGQVVELAIRLAHPTAVDQAYEEVTANGAKPVAGPSDMPWGQRTAFIADPDGNVIELFADQPKKVESDDTV